MNAKRTVNGQQFSIDQIVDEAIAAAATMPLDTERARQSLVYWGHQNPSEEVITRYAQDYNILTAMQRMTGANFTGQMGKISFASRERTIADVGSYLNRRIQGQHARWTSR
jgi:hypothetical protein